MAAKLWVLLVSSRAMALLRWVCVFTWLCGSACAPTDRPSPRHLVIVVLDTTHAAHLGCYGGPEQTSPHLDALAGRGVVFRAAHSNTTWTLPSTVSLLSGWTPERHGVVGANSAVPLDWRLLPERFREAGFHTTFYTQMIFASARHGLQRGFDEYARLSGEANTEALRQRLQAWAERSTDRRSLLYVHYRRPHSPYNPGPDALAVFDAGCPLADGRSDRELASVDSAPSVQLTDAEKEHLRHLYRANIREVDEQLGAFLQALEQAVGEDTLLVVTSDHGEGLGEHGDYGHGVLVHGEHVRIPLIVAGPGIEPRQVHAPVSTIDIAPTLYEIFDVDPPAQMDGHSLLPWLQGNEGARSPLPLSGRRYPGRYPSVAAVGPRLKLIREGSGSESLFAWRDDPGELAPLPLDEYKGAELEALRSMVKQLADWRPSDSVAGTAPLTQEQLAELRRLGYLK